MGNTVTVTKGDVVEVFENVVGHQVGNGAIQVLERSGDQRIIAGFDDVTVTLDDEASANFEFDLLAMEAKAAEPATTAPAAVPREPEDKVSEDQYPIRDLDAAEDDSAIDEAEDDIEDDAAEAEPQVH